MTDIDTLIAEAREWQRRWDLGRVTYGTEVLIGDLLDALTTERAKVAALEAEVARWREVAGELAWALKTARNGLHWYRAKHPLLVDAADDEADETIDAAITAYRAAMESE